MWRQMCCFYILLAFILHECAKWKSKIFIRLDKGTYKFELWEAQGAYGRYVNFQALNQSSAGRGAYVSGILRLIHISTFYLYIGGKGEDQTSMCETAPCPGGFNGCGKGGADYFDKTVNSPDSGAGRGGATDIRLQGDESIQALKSRIIVASGGGGGVSSNVERTGGLPAGSIEGFSNGDLVLGGTQNKGHFGYGSDGYSFSESYKDISTGGAIGGCGSGYYGGFLKNREEFLNYGIEFWWI